MLSPLKTEKIWLEKIDVSLCSDFNEEMKSADYKNTIKIGVKKRTDGLAFRITLGFTLTPAVEGHCRYERIAITTTGLFEFPADIAEEQIRQLVPQNCLAILHGFSRGVVAQVTGLNDGGPFLLPTVNFVEVLKKESKKPALPEKRA